MKTKLLVIVVLLFTFSFVNAEECLHINNNGVEMDCQIYEELQNYYSINLLDNFYQSEYDAIKNNNLEDITIESYTEPIILRGSYFSTNYKTIEIVRNGSFITVSLTWIQDPATRSHDVFAVRLVGPSVYDQPVFRQMYLVNNVITVSTTASKKTFSNGFGYSFKLPANYTGLESYITFTVTGSGTIYSSYQHAKHSVSLANSKKYTLSYSGYGHTTLFEDSVKYNYDNMSGVDLTV